MIDFERAVLLLDVQQKASANGSALTALAGEAYHELLELNKTAVEDSQARSKKEEEEAAAKAREEEAKAKAEAAKAESAPKYDPITNDSKKEGKK